MKKSPPARSATPKTAPADANSRDAASGLTLDNLEHRVEILRNVSEPTRKARAAINRASRKKTMLKRKAKMTPA